MAGSICHYVLDLIYPAARGGQLHPNNVMAIHWRAQSAVKQDAVLCSMIVRQGEPHPLQVSSMTPAGERLRVVGYSGPYSYI